MGVFASTSVRTVGGKVVPVNDQCAVGEAIPVDFYFELPGANQGCLVLHVAGVHYSIELQVGQSNFAAVFLLCKAVDSDMILCYFRVLEQVVRVNDEAIVTFPLQRQDTSDLGVERLQRTGTFV